MRGLPTSLDGSQGAVVGPDGVVVAAFAIDDQRVLRDDPVYAVFEDCDPEPFAVATWIERSFTTGARAAVRGVPWLVEVSFAGIFTPPRRGRGRPSPVPT